MDFIKIPGNYQYEISKDLVIRKKLNERTPKDTNDMIMALRAGKII